MRQTPGGGYHSFHLAEARSTLKEPGHQINRDRGFRCLVPVIQERACLNPLGVILLFIASVTNPLFHLLSCWHPSFHDSLNQIAPIVEAGDHLRRVETFTVNFKDEDLFS